MCDTKGSEKVFAIWTCQIRSEKRFPFIFLRVIKYYAIPKELLDGYIPHIIATTSYVT